MLTWLSCFNKGNQPSVGPTLPIMTITPHYKQYINQPKFDILKGNFHELIILLRSVSGYN